MRGVHILHLDGAVHSLLRVHDGIIEHATRFTTLWMTNIPFLVGSLSLGIIKSNQY